MEPSISAVVGPTSSVVDVDPSVVVVVDSMVWGVVVTSVVVVASVVVGASVVVVAPSSPRPMGPRGPEEQQAGEQTDQAGDGPGGAAGSDGVGLDVGHGT